MPGSALKKKSLIFSTCADIYLFFFTRLCQFVILVTHHVPEERVSEGCAIVNLSVLFWCPR